MRDIMMHDAHRHPYIEVLGTIYLMKLRYGQSFCSNAGSCWRLLFVYSLMPWLQKYRIFDNPNGVQYDEEGNEILTDDQVSKELFSAHKELGRSLRVVPRLLTDNDSEKKTREQIIKQLRQENEELKARLAEMEKKGKERKQKKLKKKGSNVSGDSTDGFEAFL